MSIVSTLRSLVLGMVALFALSGEGETRPDAMDLCASCHSFMPSMSHGIGPPLYGVVGRKVAGLSGYMYSRAMRQSEIVWTREELDRFLANPAKVVPGNYMAFDGVAEAGEREAIIEYMARLSE